MKKVLIVMFVASSLLFNGTANAESATVGASATISDEDAAVVLPPVVEPPPAPSTDDDAAPAGGGSDNVHILGRPDLRQQLINIRTRNRLPEFYPDSIQTIENSGSATTFSPDFGVIIQPEIIEGVLIVPELINPTTTNDRQRSDQNRLLVPVPDQEILSIFELERNSTPAYDLKRYDLLHHMMLFGFEDDDFPLNANIVYKIYGVNGTSFKNNYNVTLTGPEITLRIPLVLTPNFPPGAIRLTAEIKAGKVLSKTDGRLTLLPNETLAEISRENLFQASLPTYSFGAIWLVAAIAVLILFLILLKFGLRRGRS